MRWVALLACSGCSLAMTKAPVEDPGTRPVRCTSSELGPDVDSGVGLTLMTLSVALLATSVISTDEHNPPASERVHRAMVGVNLAVPAIWLAIAWHYGLDDARRCQQLNATPALPLPRPTLVSR